MHPLLHCLKLSMTFNTLHTYYFGVIMVNVTLRNFDDELCKELKTEAIKDDLTIVEALRQAVAAWLSLHKHKKKKKSVFDYKSVDFGPGSEKSSQEIDEILYGNERS